MPDDCRKPCVRLPDLWVICLEQCRRRLDREKSELSLWLEDMSFLPDVWLEWPSGMPLKMKLVPVFVVCSPSVCNLLQVKHHQASRTEHGAKPSGKASCICVAIAPDAEFDPSGTPDGGGQDVRESRRHGEWSGRNDHQSVFASNEVHFPNPPQA